MAAKRNKGLGKGFNALFDDVEVSVPVIDDEKAISGTNETGVKYIDSNEIKPNKKQPRKHFSKDTLKELADSIKTYGIMEPIIVRNTADAGYEIVMGERRWRAARQAGLSVVPAIEKDIDDEEMAILALIENMQREDLNPLEIAVSLNELMSDQKLTQREISSIVGKSRAYVANLLRLLKLPEKVRSYIMKGDLSGGHGKAIGMIDGEEDQIIMADRAIRENLSVHDIERLAGDLPRTKIKKKPRARRKSREIKQIEDELTSRVGAKVIINSNGSKGKVELYYYSDDELNDLIDLIRTINNKS